jgi:hypothetical protein
MRSTTAWALSVVLLILSAALLTACGERGGAGEPRANAAALEDSSEADGPVRAREQGAEPQPPPDTRSDERRRQDSVLRTPRDRQRRKLGSDSTNQP